MMAFELIKQYPGSGLSVGDIISIPNDKFIYADGSDCDEDYFRFWPEYFKEINNPSSNRGDE